MLQNQVMSTKLQSKLYLESSQKLAERCTTDLNGETHVHVCTPRHTDVKEQREGIQEKKP